MSDTAQFQQNLEPQCSLTVNVGHVIKFIQPLGLRHMSPNILLSYKILNSILITYYLHGR